MSPRWGTRPRVTHALWPGKVHPSGGPSTYCGKSLDEIRKPTDFDGRLLCVDNHYPFCLDCRAQRRLHPPTFKLPQFVKAGDEIPMKEKK